LQNSVCFGIVTGHLKLPVLDNWLRYSPSDRKPCTQLKIKIFRCVYVMNASTDCPLLIVVLKYNSVTGVATE
jgi:hypothetical protein